MLDTLFDILCNSAGRQIGYKNVMDLNVKVN